MGGMDKFQAIRAFREVARRGGFASAARALNISTPSVSRLVSDLEADIGVRLFSRSTRGVSLTEEGEVFLAEGVALFEELEAVTEEMRARRSEPRGRLRISSVIAFGQDVLVPAVAAFMERYPQVTVEVDISNRKIDLVQEPFDLAIRVGEGVGLEDSSLNARKISAQKLIFVATPDYVDRFGMPMALSDLSSHRIAKQVSGNWGRTNTLRCGDKIEEITLSDDFLVNSPNAARNAILTGQAMGLLADYLADPHLKSGALVRLLPDYETVEQPIYAVFVHRNYMPAKVRAFIDYLAEVL